MNPTTFSTRAVLIGLALTLATAGCENRSAPTNENQSPNLTERTSRTRSPATTEIVQQPKVDWYQHGQTPDSSTNPVASETEPKSSDVREPRVEIEEEPPPEKDPPIPATWKALNKDKTLFFEKTADDKRRIHILTDVCLREGPLEVLLCKAGTKEHEAILRVDLDAREIHFALIAAGAKPGTPVKFVPEYKPATGDIIRVTLTYNKDGKLQSNKPAQSWIQHIKTKKDMEHNWVFAGSRFVKFPDDPDRPPFYCANNGEIISIANFSDSMLDLPVMSSREATELGYIANKDRIPNLKSKVIVTMEVLKKG